MTWRSALTWSCLQGHHIDLHSLEYRFMFSGKDFLIRSAALPAFAADLLAFAGSEVHDVSSVIASLPWADETPQVQGSSGGGGGDGGGARRVKKMKTDLGCQSS
jgi:hypothetical protein